jgi:hypothetical protein
MRGNACRRVGNHMPTMIANVAWIKAESNEVQGTAQNGRMDRPTRHHSRAHKLDDAELHALIAATNGASHTAPGLLASLDGIPQMAPCLLAWIATACNWELHRRQGLDYELQPPKAAIPAEEEAVSIDAAICLCAMFPPGTHGAHALFDSLAEMLTGGGRKQ